MKRLNELTYIFPLAAGARPDEYTRDLCHAMYRRPMTWKMRMRLRANLHELIREVEADMLCWLGMEHVWRGEATR
jgi:hypothetical protein